MACLLSEPSTWGKTKGGMFWVAGVWLQVLSWAAMTAGVGSGRLGLLTLGSVLVTGVQASRSLPC